MYLSHKLLIATILFLLVLTIHYLLQRHQPDLAANRQIVTIIVNHGVYQPAAVTVAAGKPVRLHFVRGELGACTDHVVFPQFNLTYALSASEPTDIDLPSMLPGEVTFQCQAGSYRGKLTVV